MIYLRLFWEFFQVGLFSVGGGLATIPFLSDMAVRTGWFSHTQLADMIAISESTPGPVGANMATYTGYVTAGPLGCVVSTLGLVTPSIIVILIIAHVLKAFRCNRNVNAVFGGLRPASVALITAAGISVTQMSLFSPIDWRLIVLAAAVMLCLQIKPLKKLHPILFIAISAAVGMVFQL